MQGYWLGVADWTVRATYMTVGFVDMAGGLNQTLFGTTEQKITSKIKILSSDDMKSTGVL